MESVGNGSILERERERDSFHGGREATKHKSKKGRVDMPHIPVSLSSSADSQSGATQSSPLSQHSPPVLPIFLNPMHPSCFKSPIPTTHL